MQKTFGGNLTRDDVLIYFGPNERRIGKQYLGDPTVDEATQKLGDFSVLAWLERYAISGCPTRLRNVSLTCLVAGWPVSANLLPHHPPHHPHVPMLFPRVGMRCSSRT